VVYEFQVQISDKVERLIDFLTLKDPDGMQNYNESRFIYPMGRLKQINLDQTFEQQDIPDGAKLILMGQKSFTWDINNIGANIQLSNNNLTANKKKEQDFETVLATEGFSSGSHYWELKIDTFVDLEDLYVGIAKKNTDLYQRACDCNTFWGWMCCCGRKFNPTNGMMNVQIAEYGGLSKIHDTIGVHLEFKNGAGKLSFYRNGAFLGVAHEGIPPATYYPAVCMYYGEV
jgi:tripartite motif-containing protein 9/67